MDFTQIPHVEGESVNVALSVNFSKDYDLNDGEELEEVLQEDFESMSDEELGELVRNSTVECWDMVLNE